MKCCTPPLYKIPEGSFFCFDCSTKGTTAQLEEYLDFHETRKFQISNPNDEHSVVLDALLESDVKGDIVSSSSSTSSKSSRTKTENKFPRSELDWIHQNDPELLLYKPIRLYCPIGNSYHNGRIVDIRPHHQIDTECRVLFPAGNDNRKAPLTAWIRLEEHSIAVCVNLVYVNNNHIPSRGGVDRGWVVGRHWSRSARELVPVMHQLLRNDEYGPLRKVGDSLLYHKEKFRKPDWGLVEIILKDGPYEYLDLVKDTKVITTKDLDLELPTVGVDAKDQRKRVLMMALRTTELEQQVRISNWRSLPLINPMHQKAIKSQTEYDLGPLNFSVRSSPSPSLSSSTPLIQPSPLIQQGLDRSYLLKMACFQLETSPTKDMASSLVCYLGRTSSIQSITKHHRSRKNIHKF